MTGDLHVTAQARDRALVLRVRGILATDIGDMSPLWEATSMVPPPDSVVLDLSEAQQLTARGSRVLVKIAQSLHRRVVRCRIVVASGTPVATVLRTVELPPTVEVLDSVDQAMALADRSTPSDFGEPVFGLGAEPVAQFAELTRVLAAENTVGGVLERVVSATVGIVPGADLVSVTLHDPARGFFTQVRTDPMAADLDRIQYAAGEGPCLDAARSDGPGFAASNDLVTESRWPRFAGFAKRHGLGAVLSTDLFPLEGPGNMRGALNVYSRDARMWRTDDRQAVLLLATHASLAVTHVRAVHLAEIEAQQLHRAIQTRDVIGQAKGILIARQGLTADEAFDVLRRTSQDLNVKLVDLARVLAQHPERLDEV